LLASYTRAYGIRTYALRLTGIFPPERRAETARRARPATGWDPWLWAWVGSEDAASAHRTLMEKCEAVPPHAVFYCAADDTTALEPAASWWRATDRIYWARCAIWMATRVSSPPSAAVGRVGSANVLAEQK